MKLLLLVLRDTAREWKMPPREWFEAKTHSPSCSTKGSSSREG